MKKSKWILANREVQNDRKLTQLEECLSMAHANAKKTRRWGLSKQRKIRTWDSCQTKEGPKVLRRLDKYWVNWRHQLANNASMIKVLVNWSKFEIIDGINQKFWSLSKLILKNKSRGAKGACLTIKLSFYSNFSIFYFNSLSFLRLKIYILVVFYTSFPLFFYCYFVKEKLFVRDFSAFNKEKNNGIF